MRCTYSLCQSVTTKLIQRTCRLVYDKGKIIHYYIDDLWLCNTCGNAFTPGVSKVRLEILRKRKLSQIPKSTIIKELFVKERL